MSDEELGALLEKYQERLERFIKLLSPAAEQRTPTVFTLIVKVAQC